MGRWAVMLAVAAISLWLALPSPQPLFREEAVAVLPAAVADLVAFEDAGALHFAAVHGALGQVSVVSRHQPPGGPDEYAIRSYGTGGGPVSVNAADLDGDARADLVVVNGGSASLSVLRNAGDGSFATAVDTPLDINPRFVRCADLDGDGDLDAITVNFVAEGKGIMNILLGDGKGGFGARAARDIGDNPHAIEVGDLDGDGTLDAAVGHTDALALFRGNGDGTFRAIVNTRVRGGPSAVVAGDQNRDGRLDLVFLVATFGDNNAQLVFAEHVAGGSYATVVVSNEAGRGTRPAGGPTGFLELADLTGDQREDLVTEADVGGGGALRVHESLGDGTFPRVPGDIALREQFTDALFADVTGDGIKDLALTTASARLAIFPIAGSGELDRSSAVVDFEAGPRQIASIDADLDGDFSLVVRDAASIHALDRSGPRSFLSPRKLAGLRSPQGMAIGSFDGDAISDVAVTDLTTGSMAMLLLDASGNVVQTVSRRTQELPGPLVAGSFDAGASLDLVVADLGARELAVFFNPAGDSWRRLDVDVGSGQTAIAAGDADGDGALDIGASTGAGVTVLFGDAAGAFPRRLDLAVLRKARSLQIVDLDGDGSADLLAVAEAGSIAGRITHWRAPGEPAFEVLSDQQALHRALALDIDLDGRTDIAIAASGPEGGLKVLRGSRDGAFAAPETYAAGADVRAVEIIDLDGDGNLDAFVADQDAGTMTALWGQGTAPQVFRRGDADGTQRVDISDAVLVLRHLFLGTAEPWCLDAADANDDGRLDLADPVSILNHLFLGSEPLPPPYPEPGLDPSADALGCA